jgi:ubiquinol-cytochrome c reductase cytochrome b subunit
MFYEDRVEPVTPAELTAAIEHAEHDVVAASPTATPARIDGSPVAADDATSTRGRPLDETAPEKRIV